MLQPDTDSFSSHCIEPDSALQRQQLDEIFGTHGVFSRQLNGYRVRESQIKLAQAIADTISKQTTLIAEAGTGTGKTFAYLAPALLWGGKVLISTGTKHLQDQLFNSDIPVMRNTLQAPVTVSLLKGRANYHCRYHLERALTSGGNGSSYRLTSREEVLHLRAIEQFAKTTTTGDKSELSRVPETSPVWNLVTSTRDNCLGSECSHYQNCFVMKARKEAQTADVVVVNHHLFFADIALRDTGISELLPGFNTVIFDEAHQLPETAMLFFGQRVSTAQILELCRDIVVEGLAHAREALNWHEMIAPIERNVRELRLAFTQDQARLSLHQIAPSSTFFSSMQALRNELEAANKILEPQVQRAETLGQCQVRLQDILGILKVWGVGTNPDILFWVEVGASSLQLHSTPLLVSGIFNKQREGIECAWIFTSATLAVKRDFSHYALQMGLPAEDALSLASPFNYQQQGLLYVPPNMPAPHHPDYIEAVIEAALPVIKAAQGRTFFLCTTLRAVQRIAERLRTEFLQRGWDFPLMIQGEAGRHYLLEKFRAAGNAVLVGSQSFWEGVDVRGEALSVVIIDKLPFAPPDDPIVAAQLERLAQQGLNGFTDFTLPQAIITLKQGAGRLIRNETDRGVLMICDPRLINKSYGRRIWQSLPSFTRTRELDVVENFFKTA